MCRTLDRTLPTGLRSPQPPFCSADDHSNRVICRTERGGWGTGRGGGARVVDVSTESVPTIDIAALLPGSGAGDEARRAVAARIGDACRRYGFLQVVGHGIDPQLR